MSLYSTARPTSQRRGLLCPNHQIVGRVPQASPFCPNIAATLDGSQVWFALKDIGKTQVFDERDGIRAYRDDVDGAAIWRKVQPMHQQLALIKRTETGRRRITEMDASVSQAAREALANSVPRNSAWVIEPL
jgi:hypothetical protein